MRTVSADFIADLNPIRRISANAIFRDMRLRFTHYARTSNDAELYGDPSPVSSIDSSVIGTSILRVANVNGTLRRMLLTDPGGTWPASWTNSGVNLMDGSGIGIYESRCFYQKSDGSICYRDWSSGSFGSENSFDSGPFSACLVAPISTTGVFLLEKVAENYADLHYTNGTTVQTFPGHLYDVRDTACAFDAGTADGVNYVFFATSDDRRPWYVSHRGGRWSQVCPVIPLDIVDDETKFRLSGVETINDQLVLTGVRQSSTADGWLFYSFGPSWTMGRDCFISEHGAADGWYYGGDEMPTIGGKMHLIGNSVYVTAPGHVYVADATYLLGVDNGDYKLNMSADIGKVNMQFYGTEGGKLTMDVPADLEHQAIRVGADVDVYATLGGHTAKICTFNVDSVAKNIENDGRSQTVLGTSKGMKNLAKWAPDLNYDMWGQGKSASNPATLKELVRINGNFEVEYDEEDEPETLAIDCLNENATMYNVVRASRNGIVKARFKYTSDQIYDNYPRFGIMLNYYRETRAEAMARLGKTEGELRYNDYGENALVVAYGPDVDNGSPGFGIIWVYDNTWFTWSTYTWSATLAEGTDYWIWAEFFEGNIRIMYREEGTAAWTLVADDFIFESSTELPWSNNYVGRAGLFMNNTSPFATTPGFNSEATLLPVNSNGSLIAGIDYLVNEERILCSAKSENRTFGETCPWYDGYTLDGAPHNNEYAAEIAAIEGYEIYCRTTGVHTHHEWDYYNGLALVVANGSGVGCVYKVIGYDWQAPDQWVPYGEYTLPDTWMDHIGDPVHGEWVTEVGLRRFFVETEPRGNFGEDTEFVVEPCLEILERGYQDTEIVAHPANSMVTIFQPSRIRCDRFQYFTGEIDMSVADVFYELHRRAGNLYPQTKYAINGTMAGFGSSPSTAYANGIHQADFVCKMRRVTSAAVIGVYAGITEAVSPSTYGTLTTVSDSAINFYRILAGSASLIESVPLSAGPGSNWITFSVDRQFISVWINNRLYASFVDPDYDDLHELAPDGFSKDAVRSYYYCDSGASVEVVWPEASNRVDNFVMDMGKAGTSMLDRLIGDKHLYTRDNQDGNPTLYREGDEIGDTFELAVVAGEVQNEQGIITRARVEGMEAYEKIDAAAMKEHGNIFKNLNNEEVQSKANAMEEATYAIELSGKQVGEITVMGAADPRIEPGDIIDVELPSGTHTVKVDNISFKIDLDLRNAVSDMTIEGHEDV